MAKKVFFISSEYITVNVFVKEQKYPKNILKSEVSTATALNMTLNQRFKIHGAHFPINGNYS